MGDLYNLHRLYYKDYYKGVNFRKFLLNSSISDAKDPNITASNELLIENKDNRYSQKVDGKWELRKDLVINLSEELSPKKDRITLRIQYPGLVTGVGIDHEAKITGEFKLGVHFDWTYGMPVVYGSSVKGVLRACFKDFYKGNRDVDDYKKEIFEGALRDIESERMKYGQDWSEKIKQVKNRIYIHKPIYDRDIFFDAVILKPDSKGRILCSDSITPHGTNPLKNPTPIAFMKIAPGCTLEFQFKLVGSQEEIIEKKNLFKMILTTVGVGAKTNVGYGQLKEVSD